MSETRKNVVGERIREMRSAVGYTQVQLGDKVGVDRSSIANYETGKATPPMDIIMKLVDVFNCTTDYLLGRSDYNQFIDDKAHMVNETRVDYTITKNTLVPESAPTVEMVQIPIYGEIRAGYDSLAEQRIVGYEVVSKESVRDGDYFYLIVKGDSMIEEGIHEGMRVLVKSQNHCEHGKIGVVIVNGDEGTLKRVYYEGDTVVLQAANKGIPPRILPIYDVRIQGQVKKVEFDV
ncbi:helix-turn-helix domain-containing protein [Paenibacillus harenae]|uniref:Repressor LexA n=1 Tax=Paenibacillus harenae TaxID=306543 RepID=A0ABT9U506_PAEHA|nr:LexA family transcriptional regulator [Paenibacillus harenae]MDQ0114327.1 repressor LexA [Paenibacillus harenae]